jgi:hypothetical protein
VLSPFALLNGILPTQSLQRLLFSALDSISFFVLLRLAAAAFGKASGTDRENIFI